MRNYVACDSLNPNAVNARYGRPASMCHVLEAARFFSAENDEEAKIRLEELIGEGKVGYSAWNAERVNPSLFRTKDWFAGKLSKEILL